MIKDKLGNTIHVGDYVVYGHSLDRSAGLRVGKVLSVTPDHLGRPLEVIGVIDDYSYNKPRLTKRSSRLHYTERVIVLHHKSLPKTYIKLLESYTSKAGKK